MAFSFALLLPSLLIYLKDALDTKVHGRRDLQKLPIPYLGDVPLVANEQQLVVTHGESTNIAESFRLVRTNIEFILGAQKSGSKVIFVTSTIAKEGKSFIALNLASTILNGLTWQSVHITLLTA